MSLRLKALAAIDPLSVPLPNGTEVSTRVDRFSGEYRVPQGAIGRVVSSSGDRLTVKIIGVGLVEYARDELVPRKVGQLLFAARRAAAWEALSRCVVLETRVGSHAWGLAGEGSDEDRRGAFALPFTWTTGLYAGPEDLVGEDASTSYWEVRKAIRQGLRADPNTLECLFVAGARAVDPIGEWLLAEREAFVSREIYASFGRYALSQLKKLSQSLALAEHRTIVMDWLAAEPELALDELAARLAKETIHGEESERHAVLRAKEYIKQLCRSLHDRGLTAGNELKQLAELAQRGGAEMELPRELRPKNAYNLLRLIRGAIDWLEQGEPRFVVQGAFRDRLLSIKRGEVALDEVIAEAESMTPELEKARASTPLPAKPDVARADRLARRIAEELARRHIERAPGPFGLDAPPAPDIPEDD